MHKCLLPVALLPLCCPGPVFAQTPPAPPKLVVGIVGDQMRYDFLYRYQAKYGAGGFRRLLREGFSCEQTHYNYVPTYTGPGHAAVYTGATPSVNGTMMHVLTRLNALTGEVIHAERFSVLTQAFAEDSRRQLISAATYFNGFDLILRAIAVVIVGQRNDPAVAAFRDVFRRVSVPNKVVQIVAPGEALYEGHPANGKGQVDNKVTVYLCGGQTCSPPITDPNQLELQLKTRTLPPGTMATARA